MERGGERRGREGREGEERTEESRGQERAGDRKGEDQYHKASVITNTYNCIYSLYTEFRPFAFLSSIS